MNINLLTGLWKIFINNVTGVDKGDPYLTTSMNESQFSESAKYLKREPQVDATKRIERKFINKKRITVIYVSSIVAMTVYPPYALYMQGGGNRNMGYHFIFNSPGVATINNETLFIQFIATSLIAIALWIYQNDNGANGNQ